LLLLLALAAGCSSSGSLSGTVTSKQSNKKVMSGTVGVLGSDNVLKYGEIKPDGTYTVKGVRTGPVKVSVSSPNPKGVGLPGREGGPRRPPPEGGAPATPAVPPEVLKGWFPIADKYGDPSKSGLTTTVKGGSNTFNIELD